MASIPSKELVKAVQTETMKAEEKKSQAQAKQGKDFKNFGQGVIPERIWKNLKRGS